VRALRTTSCACRYLTSVPRGERETPFVLARREEVEQEPGGREIGRRARRRGRDLAQPRAIPTPRRREPAGALGEHAELARQQGPPSRGGGEGGFAPVRSRRAR